MDLKPSPRQQELIDLARGLAVANFAPRAAQYDREASFPFADYDDLHAAGLLALCVPEQYGGLGATFETYCLVAEHIAQGNASTALMRPWTQDIATQQAWEFALGIGSAAPSPVPHTPP